MKKAKKFSNEERSELQILHSKGYSARAIAEVLHRSPNTIAGELRRNSYASGTYVASYAKQRAYVRRKYAKFQGMKLEQHQDLRAFVIDRLRSGWNPDEVAGYLKRHRDCAKPCAEPGCGLGYISKTAIYDWLYSAYGQPWCQYLPSRRYRPRRRKAKQPGRVLIPDRVPLSERPEEAAARSTPGHWEGDCVVSGKRTGSKAALAVFVERKTRLVSARLIPDMKPERFTAAAVQVLGDKQAVTLTLDNGQENRRHAGITAATGARAYFCDPYSSWQKGSVEHANKLLRAYLPKGCDLSIFDQAYVDACVARLNKKPRKILGYKSALQLAAEKGVLTGIVS
jgi:transposase, IS30 family